MAKNRVLAIDGGGIRGLVTVVLLQRLTALPGLENLLSSVDLVAGTSTGGLLAMAIAKNLNLAEMRRTYVEGGPRIFDDSFVDDLLDLGRILGADYKIAPLRKELKRLFGDDTLGSFRKRVLITAFDLDDQASVGRHWKPKLFHNFTGPGNDRSAKAVDVGLYTSAAPTYFPSVDGFIDGGVYANNPAMCALAQTQDERYNPTPSLKDVHLLSLGTGTNMQFIQGKSLDWGYAKWAKPLVTLMLEGSSGIADYHCRQILGGRYHRLAPWFPEGVRVEVDDVSKIDFMIDFAERVPIEQTADWVRSKWMDE